MTRSLFYAGDHASEELRGGAHGRKTEQRRIYDARNEFSGLV
jgi:hypothetical protein